MKPSPRGVGLDQDEAHLWGVGVLEPDPRLRQRALVIRTERELCHRNPDLVTDRSVILLRCFYPRRWQDHPRVCAFEDISEKPWDILLDRLEEPAVYDCDVHRRNQRDGESDPHDGVGERRARPVREYPGGVEQRPRRTARPGRVPYRD